MNSWHTYPSIFALGHRAVKGLNDVPVNIEEKIDGSQLSFGLDEDGILYIRSKGADINVDAPDKMFALGVEAIKERVLRGLLHVGWTYRGEYLSKPKHVALAYDRVPNGHIIIFDINIGHEDYLCYWPKYEEAARIGLECVPLLAGAEKLNEPLLVRLLETTSVLGGQKIEGVVIKPSGYDLFGQDKKVVMAKFVSADYKETHAKEWKCSNPSSRDILGMLGRTYGTTARWQKAVQHLAECGAIEGAPRDIGGLIKEVPADVEKECKEEIMERLWGWAWPHVRRMVVAGLAEWYKQRLMEEQFAQEHTVVEVSTLPT